ncbi:MAG: hypothetical protein M3044_19760 [Thermoproteota archaeon]|nr:hypothetical protein [Thermoproteota archaeon]
MYSEKAGTKLELGEYLIRFDARKVPKKNLLGEIDALLKDLPLSFLIPREAVENLKEFYVKCIHFISCSTTSLTTTTGRNGLSLVKTN